MIEFQGHIKKVEDKSLVSGDNSTGILIYSGSITPEIMQELCKIKRSDSNRQESVIFKIEALTQPI